MFAHRTPHKGFTLIELLVVIAILGVLSGIVLASLGSARARSKDAKRVLELRQMLTIITQADLAQPGAGFAGCNSAGGDPAKNCTILSAFSDPSGSATVCTRTSTSPCQFGTLLPTSAGGTFTTQNFQICAYLEAGIGGLPAGRININSTNFRIETGCSQTS